MPITENIQPVSIVEETRHRYLHYALSVITSRALPDVRDGLKPVQRRILYTMYHDLQLHADGRPTQVRQDRRRRHGQLSSARRPCRLTMRSSAWRRTGSCAMPLVAWPGQLRLRRRRSARRRPLHRSQADRRSPTHLMAELRQHTVDMRPNYDSTREEPIVLPAQFPNLLVNGVGRHRRRHGDQHSAAQPRRSLQRLRRS